MTIKNVLVAGAHGLTGTQVINKLKLSKFTPIAGVRKDEQIKQFESDGVAGRLIDVSQTVNQLASHLDNIDAIVITVAGNSLINLDGKVKLVQAAKKVGIKRIILISAVQINKFHDDDRQERMSQLEQYAADMYYADMYVINSGTDFTSIRPGTLTNEPDTQKVQIGNGLLNDKISRADVANVVVASLENNHTIGKAFDVINGEQDISRAIQNV